MSHPLMPDLTAMSTDELTKKYLELSKRITQAYQLGYGDAINQLRSMMDSYQYEINIRNSRALDEAMRKNPGFKDIIDIQ
jgi:hypothetical protein